MRLEVGDKIRNIHNGREAIVIGIRDSGDIVLAPLGKVKKDWCTLRSSSEIEEHWVKIPYAPSKCSN